ncbi:MAG: HAD family phosphatase [Firmicutes bacterium]|nr:HAD family phosphatase [Bacillota bacterium]MCM1401533.1 HAD family phosphatase [Bacteroides sp.]MCM1476579.1 HAD family phosphatase [Bacteroides sp.]
MTDFKCGALFDLDGVLIDSESTYTEFWREIDRLYPTGIPDFALYIKGTTLPQILNHYPEPEVRDDIVRRIYAFQDTMTYSLFPGVTDFLDELAACSVPAAIVTSSDDKKMSHLFNQLPEFRKYFSAIIDASKVTRSKPHPQGYLLAAEALGIDPARCFVFEDSIQGLKAGRAAGATVIGLATTYPRCDVEPYAHLVIDSLAGFTVERMRRARELRLSKP